MLHVFKLDKANGFGDIEEFYRDFTPVLRDDLYRSAVFDLQNIEFLTLEALLALICASKLWRETKDEPVEWQTSDKVAQYLERADILHVLADDILIAELPDTRWDRGSSLSLMELRELAPSPEQNSYDVASVLSATSKLLLGRVSTKQLGSTSTLMSEIAQNVTHSTSTGYALIQSYQIGKKHRVHIGVIDTGIGIKESLSPKYPNLPRPSDYIRLSLKSGVTSKLESDGLGLYQVENIVSKDRGALTIRSGTAMIQFCKDRMYQWDGLENIQGTQVYITMWGQYESKLWNYLLQSPDK